MPADSIFTVRGYAIIDDRENLSATLALTSSKAFDFLAKLLLGRFEFPEFVVGAIQQIPLPQLSVEASRKLDRLVRQAWKSRRDLDSTREMSHAFLLPAVLSEKVTGLDRRALEQELKSIEAEIDEMAFGLYGIGPEDRTVIEVTSNRVLSSKNSEQTEADFLEGSDAAEDEDMNVGAKETLDSWLVGVVFGRFDARLATGQRSVPSDPDPFDPLPSRSLGMWPEGEISDCLADIMVDDKGRNDDLAACIQSVATRLGVEVSDNIRPWLAKEFFPLHIKMYSKSRRKAPIYWQLATPSANYSAWLYIHAFTKDTLFRVQHDYVAPKLAHESRLLESLRDELGDRGAASKRKALAAQEAFVEELRTFLEEVKRVAPIWNPNLDDGVIINFAPLWRLVPQHKAWQKELKATLDALCEGKYDWSHLAMRLWPERVVPKCVDDRSLAIAHGLELIFWEEDAAGVWKQRETPISPVEKVVANRSSEAVKAALKSLMEAPDLNGPGKRGRKSARA
jgi:hypothetical protein